MADSTKLRLRVVYSTSEDPDYPAAQLNEVTPNTKGWMSARFCSFPQELGFQILAGESKITQFQLLSHQNKISSKIEIFIGRGSSYETATFKRLGYMSLDSNEKSSYQARELKTVFIDHVGSFLRLFVNENHKNKLNTFNQVGIVALSLLGFSLNEPDNRLLTSPRSSALPHSSKNPYNDLTVDINLDSHTANKLRQLAEAKSKAIENEDYLTAKQIKTVEQELKTLGSRLAQLDMAKAEAVAAEDYDLAKDIKDECVSLRLEIEEKIRTIQIPGMRISSLERREPEFPSSKNADFGYDEVLVQKGSSREVREMMSSGKKNKPSEPVVEQSNFYEQVDNDNSDSRPIRPKAVIDYNDYDPMVESKEPVIPSEKFPEGDHPLEGVRDFLNLPSPEPLSTIAREYCESNGITKLIGEYRSRCLYSKTWTVREAVMIKLIQLLKTDFRDESFSALAPLCAILKLGVEDKIQQVLFSSITLLENTLQMCKSVKLAKSSVAPLFDPVLTQLVDKLADGNARLREGARKGLDLLAASPQVGPSAVAYHISKPLPPKQKSNWRPIAARIGILTSLVNGYGLGQSSGLNMDSLLNFLKTSQAYSHSNGEVRDAAKDLVVSIQRIVGTPPLEPTLSLLRKKQREEYEAAFENAIEPSSSKEAPQTKRTDFTHQHATQLPGGKVPTSAVQTRIESTEASQEKTGSEFSTCMFCGTQNNSWSENDLDLHYWKDCPLLISCPSCTQIVEIAGLPEHLLDECEHKASYIPCEITGLAIRKEEFDEWQHSSRCKPSPDNFMYCPLCLTTVEDSDDAWLDHLTRQCKNNKRIQK